MKTITMKRTHLITGIFVAMIALLISAQQAMAQNSVSIKSKNGVHTYTSSRGSQRLNVEYDGKIVFADDDKSIKSISRGGYMLIRKTSFGQRREVLVEPDGDKVSYEYRVGRRRQEWNQEAEEFLADVLIEVIRTTSIGAEGRVERFYTKGGMEAVLEEVDEIRSDFVSHVYLQILLDEYDLSDEDLVKLARYVPGELDSDHYITEVFKDNSDKFLKNTVTTNAFLSAIGRMDSDHYISLILTRALREDLDDDALIKVIDALDAVYQDSIYYEDQFLSLDKDLLIQKSEAFNEAMGVTDGPQEFWDKFLALYGENAGRVSLSRVAYNDNEDEALFAATTFMRSGFGYLVHMVKTNNVWTIENVANIFVIN